MPRLTLLAAAAAAALAAADAALAQQPAAPAAPPAGAPAGPPPNPYRQMYTDNCASCHGTDLAGGRAPSVFAPALLEARTDDQLAQAIRNGNEAKGMPPFKDVLSESDAWSLIAYVRNQSGFLREHPPYVPSPDGQVIQSEKQKFRIEVVAAGLETPWGMAFLPDGRLLVTERPGRLRVVADGRLSEPVKGLPAIWSQEQDSGLFDVAVHPDYAANGWIYLSFAELLPGAPAQPNTTFPGQPPVPPSMTVVVRGRINERNEWVDQQTIYRAPPEVYTPSNIHYGSRFTFDAEGHLFFSIGERGVMGNAQDLSSPLGKIHRVNDDGSIPADNPFVGVEGAAPSIWSLGHRNPQGFAWDARTGLLWESEHGPTGGDEINIVEKAKNYGWGVISMGMQRGITERAHEGMEAPVVYYTPTIAPSGIAFYEGDRYPGWRGSLFVAGLGGQQLRRLEVEGRAVTHQEVLFEQFGRTREPVVGPDGLIYVLLQNPTGGTTGINLSATTPGMLIRLVPVE